MITATKPKKDYLKPSTITLTDFMRIQNEIIPSNAEYENRRDRDLRLKHLSDTKAQNWSDSIETKKKNEFESHKKHFLEQELLKRKIDEEEKKFVNAQNAIVLERAKNMLFAQQDPVKTFHATMMYSDMLKERDFQKEISDRKKEINKTIEKQFFDMEQKQMAEYDQNELEKVKKAQAKKEERMKIIHEQLQEAKLRRIQDYQERIIEGQLMKMATQRAIDEDKKREEELKQQKQRQKEEFYKANEALEKLKEEKKLKELEEDKKIEEFAFKKQQLAELRDKVAEDKFKEKQAQRQKLIDKQIEYLNSLNKKEEEIFQKNLKEAEEKKKKEEEKKKARYDMMRKAIDDQREYIKKKKEEKKMLDMKEEAEFVDDWKKKMKQIEEDEKMEYLALKERNKSLAEFQKRQLEEKRNNAKEEFMRLTEDSYKKKYKIEKENDEFMNYAENCIRDYHKQGKNITPMLLELKRYKKAQING